MQIAGNRRQHSTFKWEVGHDRIHAKVRAAPGIIQGTKRTVIENYQTSGGYYISVLGKEKWVRKKMELTLSIASALDVLVES